MVYYAYFHSIINYGLIFWGNSSHIAKIFRIQKYIIRIITECRSRLMQRFKNLKILPLLSQHILSLLSLVVKNKNKLKLKSDVYNINSRQKHNFYQPT